MGECMTFPDTVEEFMEQYKIVDTEEVYTNGTEMVPIFRMKQWFEHNTSNSILEKVIKIIESEPINGWVKEHLIQEIEMLFVQSV